MELISYKESEKLVAAGVEPAEVSRRKWAAILDALHQVSESLADQCGLCIAGKEATGSRCITEEICESCIYPEEKKPYSYLKCLCDIDQFGISLKATIRRAEHIIGKLESVAYTYAPEDKK